MTFRPAYDEITLALGGNTVCLRPSLRAASYFARGNGLTTLHRRIAEFHLGTIRDLITKAATDRQEAFAFLDQLDRTPLKAVADAIAASALNLVAGFIPAPDDTGNPARTGKPVPWPDFYRDLYRTATGWLGWTAEAAWNATPTEINNAIVGHIDYLKLTGVLVAGKDQKPTDPEQAARNVAKGLDPEFDREGLR
ncbi:hypothetical protein ACLIR7_07200 [Nitratireductor aquimarinus]|uniref:hypothetical protein n=1 Tax=Nitratireductor aquimarinus TaxID=889300 RepID=UPI00398F4F22